jgi:hypothetical protein
MLAQLGGECTICGLQEPVCLHIHHMDPRKKTGRKRVSLHRQNKEQQTKEIDSCSILCANCHMQNHYPSMIVKTLSRMLCKNRNTPGHYVSKCKYCRNVDEKVRLQLRKQKLIDMKGGGCQLCGYSSCNAALHFHHIDPTTKAFGISARSMKFNHRLLIEELEKCNLLCANCHLILEYK